MSDETAAAMMDCKVGFVGGGKMAQAMAKGFIAAKMIQAENVMASARTEETISKWTVREIFYLK